MAYKGYRVRNASLTVSTLLTSICTAIAAMGWTLHDDVSASKKVYKSNGEDGLKHYGYVSLSIVSQQIYFDAYVFWDASAHVGYSPAISNGTTSLNSLSWITPSTTADYYIYGNKDMVFVGVQGGSYHCGFGHVPSPVDTTPVTALTSAVAAGSDKTIAVSSSSGFAKNTNYMMVDFATGNRDTVLVSDIPDGTSLKIYSVPRNYASGTYIGPCPVRFGVWQSSALRFYATAVPKYSAGTALTASNHEFFVDSLAIGNVNDVTDRNLLTPFLVRSASAFLGFSGTLSVTKAFAATSGDVWGLCNGWSPEQGQATSATVGTIVDGSKAWDVNQWIDKYVIIVEGTGINQVRKITASGTTELTVASNWTTTPDGTSVYRIVDQAWRAIPGSFMALETDHAI